MEPITDYHQTIREWITRFSKNPNCDFGSALHSDSSRYPMVEGGGNFVAGKMVVRALNTGVDALRAIVDMENRQKRVGLNVPGLSVLSRTGMVSASLAIWLLEPDDADIRFEHGLRLSRENIKQFKAFADKDGVYTKTVDPKMTEVATAFRELAKAEVAEIEKVMTQHGFNPGRQVENSAILFEIAQRLNGWDGDATDYRKPVLDAWRKTSGFAHALAWQYEIAFDLPPDDFYDDVVAAPTILMAIAIDLFDKRRTA